MADFADVPDRILLITGDLVDDPTPRALDEALAVIASFRQTGLFTDIQAVAGNHDVKRPSQRAGRHDVYDYLHLPRSSRASITARLGSIWCCWTSQSREPHNARERPYRRERPTARLSRIPPG